jgi:hypothetical protein
MEVHMAKVVLSKPDLLHKAKRKMGFLLNQSIKNDTQGLTGDSYIKEIVEDYESKQNSWEYRGPHNAGKPAFDPNVLKIIGRVETSPPQTQREARIGIESKTTP